MEEYIESDYKNPRINDFLGPLAAVGLREGVYFRDPNCTPFVSHIRASDCNKVCKA